VVGGLTVLIWKQLNLFGLYEIVPGFIFALIAIYVVSMLTPPPEKSMVAVFEKTEKLVRETE